MMSSENESEPDVGLYMQGNGRFYDEGGAEWEITKIDYERLAANCKCNHCVVERAVAPVRVRHKKRGTEYVLIGTGRMQAKWWFGEQTMGDRNMSSVDMREVAIYCSVDDGSFWVRPVDEFWDGRFEKV